MYDYLYDDIEDPGPWKRTPWWFVWRRVRGQNWRRMRWRWASDVPHLLEPEWQYCRDIDFLTMD